MILTALFLVLIVPVLVFGQGTTESKPIIPNCSPNCGFSDLMQLINNLINWIIMISIPIAAGVFAWAGIKYMITGVANTKNEAKDMMVKVLIGFAAILAAWIIVTTITNALLSDDFKKEPLLQGVGNTK